MKILARRVRSWHTTSCVPELFSRYAKAEYRGLRGKDWDSAQVAPLGSNWWCPRRDSNPSPSGLPILCCVTRGPGFSENGPLSSSSASEAPPTYQLRADPVYYMCVKFARCPLPVD